MSACPRPERQRHHPAGLPGSVADRDRLDELGLVLGRADVDLRRATAATLPATAAALATSAATSAITGRLGLGIAPTLPGAFAAPPPIAALAAAPAPLVSVAPQWVAALSAISETPTSIPAAVSSPV